ncbi:MAG: co-chaperone GroES [Clostridiales bacterium]|nr:co-chaperone GroES [Candidatus Apopatousia equi]
MKIKPLQDKIVVKEVDLKQKESSGGIILPSSLEEKPIVAKVIATGDGGIVDGEKQEMLVKKGDTIIFSKFAGFEFKIENENYIVLKQADVLAILED